jgi:hypothetical protein
MADAAVVHRWKKRQNGAPEHSVDEDGEKEAHRSRKDQKKFPKDS